METEAENDNKLFQNSIKYLHSISNMKALDVPALKSFYSTKGRLMELRNAVYLPFNLTKTSVRCQRCLINLSDGPASYKIKAQEKKSKFARKVLAKFHRDKPLTKYQRKYIKHLDEFNGNHLAITCKFCKKESLIKLEKPKKIVRSKGSKNIPQKKKRIKKKDKFCGLNEEAVLSLTPQNVRDLDDSTLETNNKKTSHFKLSKKKTLPKKTLSKESIKENQMELKKKTKKLNKLNQFLSSSSVSKSGTNLKHFLQSL